MADNDNTITVVGRIGHEPELRTTPQGAEVLNFSVATTERKRAADGTWSDGATSWFRVAAWGALGRNAALSFHRGQRVVVHGVLRIAEFPLQNGGRSARAELRATALGHDVAWGTSSFSDAGRQGAAQPTTASQQEREEQQQQERVLETVPAAPPSDWGSSLPGLDEPPF